MNHKTRIAVIVTMILGLAFSAIAAGKANPKATGDFTFDGNAPGAGTAHVVFNAQQIDEDGTGKGTLFYTDQTGYVLFLEVKCVNVVGGNMTAYFGAKVIEPTNYPGLNVGTWFLEKVVDNGEPGAGHDTINGASFPNGPPSDVCAAVKAATVDTDRMLQTGDLVITGGNLQVHP